MDDSTKIEKQRETTTESSANRQQESEQQVILALGKAVVRGWGDIPQPVQRMLFDDATDGLAEDDSLRDALAIYLHDHHPRTDGAH